MTLREKKALQVGDYVRWINPDNPNCPGHYRIQEIVTESGLLNTEDDVLVVTDDDGCCSEVYLYEIG